ATSLILLFEELPRELVRGQIACDREGNDPRACPVSRHGLTHCVLGSPAIALRIRHRRCSSSPLARVADCDAMQTLDAFLEAFELRKLPLLGYELLELLYHVIGGVHQIFGDLPLPRVTARENGDRLLLLGLL